MIVIIRNVMQVVMMLKLNGCVSSGGGCGLAADCLDVSSWKCLMFKDG